MGCGSWIKDSIGMFILSYLMLVMMIYSYLPGSGIWFFLIICIVLLGLMIAGGWALVIPLSEIYLFIIYPTVKIWLWTGVALIKLGVFFLSYPFLFLGASGSWIMDVYGGAIGNMITNKPVKSDDVRTSGDTKKRPKASYTIIFLFFSFILLSFFGSGPEGWLQLITQATFIVPLIALISLGLTITISGLVKKYSGGEDGEDQQQKEVQGRQEGKERSAGPDEAISALDAGEKIGENSARMYKDLKKTKKTYNKIGDKHKKKVGKVARKGGGKAQKMLGTVSDSARLIPLFGNTLMGIAGVGSGVTGALLSGGLLLIALLILFVVSTAILSIFLGLFWSIVVAPFLSEILGGMAGPAAAVAGYANSWVFFSGSIAPDIPALDFTEERNAIKGLQTNLGCYLDPATLRECQRNQSRRPGAEAQGKEFALEVSRFRLGAGNEYNIGGLDKKDGPRVSLSLSNPVKNRYGIDARNVFYRVRIESDAKPAGCKTSYLPIGQSGRIDDIEGGGTISAGRTATPATQPDNLTIANCGLLQPTKAGISVTPKTDIIYNYSSVSDVDVRMMSANHLGSENTDIQQDRRKSKTADTPVQAFLNPVEPVTFNSSGEMEPTPMTLQIGFQATGYGLDGYRGIPEDIEITMGDLVPVTEIDSINGNCKDLTKIDDNTYELSDSGLEKSFRTQRFREDFWYTKGNQPSYLNCRVAIKPNLIEDISPTGETTRLTIDANYTVLNTEFMKSSGGSARRTLDVVNRRCRPGLPCPLLVTKEEANETNKLRYTCDPSWRFDAEAFGGCTVVKNQPDWGNPIKYNNDNSYSSTIKPGESALTIKEVKKQIDQNPPQYNGEDWGEGLKTDSFLTLDDSIAVGIKNPPTKVSRSEFAGVSIQDEHAGWVLYREGGSKPDIKLEKLNTAFCPESSEQQILETIADQVGTLKENIIYTQYIHIHEDIGSATQLGLDLLSGGLLYERECNAAGYWENEGWKSGGSDGTDSGTYGSETRNEEGHPGY
jgi:hypothetical protein